MQCNELPSSLSLPEICSNHKLIYVLKTPEIWLHTQRESKRNKLPQVLLTRALRRPPIFPLILPRCYIIQDTPTQPRTHCIPHCYHTPSSNLKEATTSALATRQKSISHFAHSCPSLTIFTFTYFLIPLLNYKTWSSTRAAPLS